MIGRIWLPVEHCRKRELPAGGVIVAAPQGSEAVDDIGGGAEQTIDGELEDTDRRAVPRVNVTRLRVSVNA